MIYDAEYTAQKISDMAPKSQFIMGGNQNQKNVDKHEINLFEKMYRHFKKVI